MHTDRIVSMVKNISMYLREVGMSLSKSTTKRCPHKWNYRGFPVRKDFVRKHLKALAQFRTKTVFVQMKLR